MAPRPRTPEPASARRRGPARFQASLAGALALACALAPVPLGASDAPPGAAPGAADARAASHAPESRRRGLWVLCEGSQRVLEHAERLDVLLADAQALGVTDLYVQVYRGGRAWFPTPLADDGPYATTFRDGGRDALQVLLERAHALGLRVHAWVNVLALASNAAAPIVAELGRSAVLVDQKGRSLLDYPEFDVPPPDRSYLRLGTPGVWLDPASPAVVDRLAALFAGLVKRYPGLDGLHLDYIRYADALPMAPGSRFGVGLHFGYGEASRRRFTHETGLAAPFGDDLQNASRFDDWRRAQLTALVREIGQRARAARPGLELSAAVIPDAERAYLADLQDWTSWIDAGLLDHAVPMLYTLDPTIFSIGVATFTGLTRGHPGALQVGLGTWLFDDDPAGAVAQPRRVEAEPSLGLSFFSWDSLRESQALIEALATETARERLAAAR